MTKFLATAKAWAALVGAVVTAVLATVPPHTTTWTVLTFVAAVVTAVATYQVPNRPAVAGKRRSESGETVSWFPLAVVVLLVLILLAVLGVL